MAEQQSVLIITPFFAPQSHAAVFRAYKLAKYLPQYGWKPYVVTTDTNYLYNEDQGLLDALPSEVEIHRARYLEPTARGLRMALGGHDRTFKSIKASYTETASSEAQPLASPDLFRRFYRYLLDAWLHVPDAYWTWERPAVKMASDLIQRHQIPLVLTSALPYTSHRIGFRLKQRLGVRWIADFRDPATHSHRMFSPFERVFLRQRRAENLAVQHADAITVLAESYALILTETYGLKDNSRIHFISTGLDESLLESPRENAHRLSSPYLVFVGEFLTSYDDSFFRIFSQVVRNPQVAQTGVKILFIGREDVNGPLITPLARQYELERFIEIIDHLPQEQLYNYIREARAGLLIPGRRALWWSLYAKLVDYIALQKPVVAIVPNPSEARMHLERSGLGIFLDDQERAAEQLTRFILSDTDVPEVDVEYCKQFLVKSQVSAFIKVFEHVIESSQLRKFKSD